MVLMVALVPTPKPLTLHVRLLVRLLFWLTFGAAMWFSITWLLLVEYWGFINNYFAGFTGVPFNIMALFVMATIGLDMYVGWLCFGHVSRKLRRNGILPRKIHLVLPALIAVALITTLILVGGFIPSEVVASLHFFEYTYIPVALSLAFLLPVVARRCGKMLSRPLSRGKTPLALSTYCIFFVLILLFPPAFSLPASLPAKPAIVGHRGGLQLGPENTLEVAGTALDYGIVGWEVDIQISLDGVPFLLHDLDLLRTTNVREVFPDRAANPAMTFTWAELEKLNAGSWFVEQDPFGTIATGVVSPEKLTTYLGARIPSLAQVVNFSRDHHLLLNVDLREAPYGHPFEVQFFNLTYQIISQCNLTAGAWFNTSPVNLAKYAPASSQILLMKSTSSFAPVSVEDFQVSGRDLVNAHDSLPNKYYRLYEAAGIPLNVYGVPTAWRFAQVWCLGADYVTTDAPQHCAAVASPGLWMSMGYYFATVAIIGSAGIATTIAIILRRHYSRASVFSASARDTAPPLH